MASNDDPYVHFVTNTATTNTLGTSFTVPAGTLSEEILFSYIKGLNKQVGDYILEGRYNDAFLVKNPEPIDTYDDVEEI